MLEGTEHDKAIFKEKWRITVLRKTNLVSKKIPFDPNINEIKEKEKRMGRLLIIGCGGVAGVAIHKCCQNSKTFSEICIASRTKEKCDTLKKKLEANNRYEDYNGTGGMQDNVDELVALIKDYQPDAVLNVALPYQDLTIMEACLECKVDYIDTANYEPEDTDDPEWRAIYEKRCKEAGFTAYFDYSWQWAYRTDSKKRGLQLSWEADLIRALQVYLQPMR